jgi:predicted dehydrogenase
MTLSRRRFLEDALLAAAAASVAARPLAAATFAPPARRAEDPLRIAVIGVRGRGRDHIASCKANPDAQVVAICDPDEAVIGPAARAVPDAKYVKDFRAVLDDPEVDAVSIATPNHWHALAAVWALQAGKHVFVEKPLSHDLREGRLLVNAARRYGKVVQHGTQARSHAACRDAIAWLQAGGLGAVKLATGLCYKPRASIGKVAGAQEPPASCDYDLWTGPAALEPLRRKSLHYDWHWSFNTGNGDLGNQGVHQMDLARWGLGLDVHPARIAALGGRFGYDDDGETPNSQICFYDWGDKQVLFEVRGLATEARLGARIATLFHGEGGTLVIEDYARAVVLDAELKPAQIFEGGGDHFADFVTAARAGAAQGSAPAEEGHLSSALCHLGNVAWQLGDTRPLDAAAAPFGEHAAAQDAVARFRAHLAANGVAADAPMRVCEALSFDAAAESFTGARAAAANALNARPGRGAFAFPKDL